MNTELTRFFCGGRVLGSEARKIVVDYVTKNTPRGANYTCLTDYSISCLRNRARRILFFPRDSTRFRRLLVGVNRTGGIMSDKRHTPELKDVVNEARKLFHLSGGEIMEL